MRIYISFIIIMLVLLTVGCKQNRVVIRQPDIPPSKYYFDDDKNIIMKKIADKFVECEDGTYQINAQYYLNTLIITSSSFGQQTFIVDKNTIRAFPEFDTMHKRQANLFKMAVNGESGCPK